MGGKIADHARQMQVYIVYATKALLTF